MGFGLVLTAILMFKSVKLRAGMPGIEGRVAGTTRGHL